MTSSLDYNWIPLLKDVTFYYIGIDFKWVLFLWFQMVWAKSVKFGCGKARSRTGKIIVVANYEPKVSQLHVLTKCLFDEVRRMILTLHYLIFYTLNWNSGILSLWYCLELSITAKLNWVHHVLRTIFPEPNFGLP